MTPYYPPHNVDDIDPRVVDDLLSKELLQLSFEDRNAIDEEIHGVHTLAREETPALIDLELKRLAVELNLLDPNHCIDGDPSLVIAYSKSQLIKNTYVNTDNFRLRFLRCEFFDAKKAACRMCKFLNAVLEFCGEYALERPIRIRDLSKSELQLLRTGNIQIFPFRDRSGRPIFCWVGDFTMSSSDTKERVRRWIFRFDICSSSFVAVVAVAAAVAVSSTIHF
jgi:hypothetical protein